MAAPTLTCTVRECGRMLERRTHAFVCANGHAFDIARSGYVNLLQPQHRRSLDAGDSRDSVRARAAVLSQTAAGDVIDAFAGQAAALDLDDPAPAVVDLGSGTGETLAALLARRPMGGVGIDLSTAAVELAARRFPSITWVVANADRRLPFPDGSVDLVLSFNGRRNPAECARILGRRGALLIGIPAADDLIELREAVLGEKMERDRSQPLIDAHRGLFTLRQRSTIRRRAKLERQALVDLLGATYRGGRRSEADRVAALDRLEVTLATDCFLFDRV